MRQVYVVRNRDKRKNTGLFDTPDWRHDDDGSADNGESVGVFGGPTHDSRLLGGPGHPSGLFDAPDRAPGDMPGLFARPAPASVDGRGLLTKPAGGSGQSVGLFDKPRRADRT